MSEQPVFAVGGENLIDHVTNEGQLSAKVGGSPFNVAMGLGRLGHEVRYVSPISTDDWGDQLAAALTDSGVDLTGGRVDLPTTMARVEITKGIPSYRFERDGTAERDIRLEDITQRLEGVSAVHTGSLALTLGPDADAWEAALAQAYDRGVFVSLDPNVRLSVIEDAEAYRARILRMVQKATLLKLSDEDLEALYPGLDLDKALDTLRAASNAALIVLTQGPEGARAIQGETSVQITASPVPNLVDAVGAGDTFAATLLSGLALSDALSAQALRTMSRDGIEALLRGASTAAAINCGREGCDPPTRAELDGALAG